MILKKQFFVIIGTLGEKNVETPLSNDEVDLKLIKQVQSAVRTVSKYTFWESKCLVQAFTAKIILSKRKQKTTVYLGVSKNEAGLMIAHAWVRCGTVYVTGGNGSEKFTVTSCFGDK